MNPIDKTPVTGRTGYPNAGKATPLNRILTRRKR